MIQLILAILVIWLLIKAICFIFRLTWGAAKVIGITIAICAALALVSGFLL